MRSPIPRPVRVVCGLVLIAFLLPAAAHGQWRERYNEGREAFDAGRYAAAVTALEKAIAERGEERAGGGLIAGRRYIPRYYLGAALGELGRCAEALRVFAEAETQGAIQKTPEHADLTRRKAACQERLRRIAAALAEARAALDQAQAAARELRPIKVSPTLSAVWSEGDDPLATLEERASRTLQQARDRLLAGERENDEAAIRSSRDIALRAASAYRDLTEEARSRLGAINRATNTALETLESSEAAAHRTLRSVADLEPYPRQLGERVAALTALLEQTTERKASASPEELTRIEAELTRLAQAVREAARRPPEKLVAAVERHLAGDYRGVLATLADAKLDDTRARAHACLLRAAAAFALRELGDEDDGDDDGGAEDREASLQSALAGCRGLSPPEPDRRFFSPRFIAYFERTLATPDDR